MKRVRTREGEWWSVYIDTTGPRLRWRPLQWWQARDAARLEERRRRAAAGGDAERKDRWWHAIDPFAETEVALFVIVVVILLLFLTMLFGLVVLPVVVVAIDGVLLVVGSTVLFLWRTVIRSGWTVIARPDGGEERRWRAGGWRDARHSQKLIARAIATGQALESPRATEIVPD